jgi:glucosyl-dolichyl phosphate glucuronosyltransferase
LPLGDVSVVICAYTEERWSDLCAAVESVRRQALPALEIIVVIDHNSALLERAQASLVGARVIENSQVRGLAGARNSGCAVATGTIVAFLDDDAVANPDWLERLRAPYEQPHVMGVGGHVEPMWLSGRPRWFPSEFGWVVGCAYAGLPTTPAEVRNLIGANMSFRREVIGSLGGFSSHVGRVGKQLVHCEETEFCIRLKQRLPDAVLVHEPRAIVEHRVPAGRTRWGYFSARCYTEGQSKARVSRMVGARDGLSRERGYVLRTLPRGIARSLADVVVRRDRAGSLRAAAIVAGLTLTGAGYLQGRVWPSGTGSN